MATPMQMPGLLGGIDDEEIQNQAMKMAALQAGLTGLMASGPSLMPVSTGQVLGQVGLTGVGAYQQGLQQAQQQQVQRQTQQAIRSALGGQQPGAELDTDALSDLYMKIGVALSATNPEQAKFYFQASKDVKEKSEKLTGSTANLAYAMYGKADPRKLTKEELQNVLAVEQEQKMRVAAKQAPAAPVVNVSYGKSFGSDLAGEQVKMIAGSHAQAQGAAETLYTVNEVEPILDEAFTGPGANVQIAIARIGEKLGIGGRDQADRLRSTSALIKSAAQLELDAAAKMRGQGAITENERVILRKAASVDPAELTATEIKEVFRILKKSSTARISSHNATLDRFIETVPEAQKNLELYRVRPPVPVRRVQ